MRSCGNFVHDLLKLHVASDLTAVYMVVLQADQICYAVLCVFSYVAAGHKRRRPGPAPPLPGHTPASGSVSPRGPRFSSHQ